MKDYQHVELRCKQDCVTPPKKKNKRKKLTETEIFTSGLVAQYSACSKRKHPAQFF